MTIPTAGLAYVCSATPGQPVNALDANLAGGYVENPLTAPGVLYVDPTGPASVTANGTTSAISPGQSFYAISYSSVVVSVASNYPNHQFISVQWR
jgi:cellulase/cellobiase CelA1